MSKLGKELKIGFGTYSRAMSIVFSRNMWWVFIVPVILNILIFYFGNSYVNSLADAAVNKTTSYITSWFEYSWLETFNKIFGFILWILIKIIFYIVFIYTSGYIVMVLMSPIYAYVSEKTEEMVTGKKYPTNFKQFMKDILRGVSLATRNFVIEILLTIVLIVVSFIPLLGFFTPICLLVIASYFYGYSFMDYSLERRKLKIKESNLFVRKHKGVAVSNGLVFSIMLAIPFCGVFLGAFFSVISVIAATMAIVEIEKESGEIN